MRISSSVTITVTDPESHPHDTSSDSHTHALDVSHSEQILFAARSLYHINHTINRSWIVAFSLAEGEIPSLAASMAVGDAKNTIPEDAKASFVRRFVKDTFLDQAHIFSVAQIGKNALFPVTSKCSWRAWGPFNSLVACVPFVTFRPL